MRIYSLVLMGCTAAASALPYSASAATESDGVGHSMQLRLHSADSALTIARGRGADDAPGDDRGGGRGKRGG